jgi:hypothetical protein
MLQLQRDLQPQLIVVSLDRLPSVSFSAPWSRAPTLHQYTFLLLLSCLRRLVGVLPCISWRRPHMLRCDSPQATCAAAFSNFLHAMPPRRCSSLQELEVVWQEDTDGDHRNRLEFKGTGCTPAEQRASMQRQLAALCSSTAFMAPDSWPPCSCLAALTVHRASIQAQEVFLTAGTRTPSLVHLEVQMDDDSTTAPLRSLSDLQRLTHLKYAHPCAAALVASRTTETCSHRQCKPVVHLDM